MAKNNTNSYYDNGIASMLMADYVNAKNLEASRPMKESTTTIATTKPVEYQDMLKRRNQIGTATQTLNDILKQRETPLYGLGSLMAQMPEQSGPGSWLGSFARGLGGGLTFGTNAAIDRAQRNYENAQNDLQTALAFDRAMGDTQTQTQINKYTPVEYSTGRGGGSGSGGGSGLQTFAGIPTEGFGRSVGYDPVADLPDFTAITRAAANGEQLSLGSWLNIPGTAAVAKGLTGQGSADLQTTYSDIADNILSGKILDFVQQAGSIRLADTEAERQSIFGPLQGYNNMSDVELRQAIDRSRNNFVSLGVKKAREQGRTDITPEVLTTLYNSAFTVPASLENSNRYNMQNVNKYNANSTSVPVNTASPNNNNDDIWEKYRNIE